MRITGKNIRFVIIDKSTDQVITTQWIGMVARVYGLTLRTMKKWWHDEEGNLKDQIERDNIVTYRCEEFYLKKRNTLFMSGTSIQKQRIRNLFKFSTKSK